MYLTSMVRISPILKDNKQILHVLNQYGQDFSHIDGQQTGQNYHFSHHHHRQYYYNKVGMRTSYLKN